MDNDATKSGRLLIAAAGLFWAAWLLMPGVGVTDAKQIFALVSSQRGLVAVSVIVQLVSSVLYVPGLLHLVVHPRLGAERGVRRASGLLLVGAMGLAADAVLHLLAYAMTIDGVETGAMVPVMTFMQGPGLVLLLPLILAFFVGGGQLSYALVKAGIAPRRSAQLHWLALAFAIVGGVLAGLGLLNARAVGLLTLALVSGGQVWAGVSLMRLRASVPALQVDRQAA